MSKRNGQGEQEVITTGLESTGETCGACGTVLYVKLDDEDLMAVYDYSGNPTCLATTDHLHTFDS